MKQPLLTLTLILTACGTPTEDTAGDPPLPRATSTLTCGETPPVIDSLTVTDNGLYICEKGQPASPSVLVSVSTHDDDGDINVYEFDLVWDLNVDGLFGSSASSYHNIGTLSNDECSVSQANIGVVLCMGGGDPPYSTEVEFGAIITDANGNSSNYGEFVITSAVTPDPK